MKVGLFFGSFNPVHIGHLVIANYLVEFTDIEQLWFVISPQNPLKVNKSLLNEYERLELVERAIKDDYRFRSCDIEFKMPRPSYTIDTLLYLNEKYPDHQFVPIMGADTAAGIHKWKNYDKILKNYEVYVYPRPDINAEEVCRKYGMKLFNAPLMKISASFIRNAIKNKKSVRFMLPDTVIEYIDKWGLYL